MLAEARQNVAIFFRTGGGTPRLGGGSQLSWNGKASTSSKKPCVAFNFAREHKHDVLEETGTCRFGHFCMQWVSDKGPRGMCGGPHPKLECTYDAAKRVDKPV